MLRLQLRKIAVFGLQYLIGIPLLFLALTMIFGPPSALIWETIDLCRMRERTVGTVDAANVQSDRGMSRPAIKYHFSANAREIHSMRYAPGFVANWVRWTGGGKAVRNFTAGKQVMVYFSAGRPELCALEYGWFSWSVGLTMIYGGYVLQPMSEGLRSKRWRQSLVKYAGQSCVVYGFALIFVGPPVVRVFELPWHGLAWAGALVAAFLYAWWRRSEKQADARSVSV